MQDWQSPRFEELTMNAEVGAYQEDFGDDPRPIGKLAQEPRTYVSVDSQFVEQAA